jgi:nitrogen regulatory protein P-II 1
MKLVKCVVAPKQLDKIQEVLLRQGVQGMTVQEVKGFGIHRAQLQQKVSRNYLVEFIPRVMIEIVLPDDQVGPVVKTLMTVARTGRVGDGKLFVLPVEEAVRLRTGERGDAAL